MKRIIACNLSLILAIMIPGTSGTWKTLGQTQQPRSSVDSTVIVSPDGSRTVTYSSRPFDFGPIKPPAPGKRLPFVYSENEKNAYIEGFRTKDEAERQKLRNKRASLRAPSNADYSLYAVGEIPIQEGVSPSGARTYQIPIATAPGFKLTPSIAIGYNSQAGDGWVGYGWDIQGYSTIRLINKSKYYHEEIKGANIWDKDASFALDGIPLVENTQVETKSQYPLVTATGFILVSPTYNSNGYVSSFTAIYPNGLKAKFGYYANGNTNLTSYPITELTDFDGNKITFSYMEDYLGRINTIQYGFDASGHPAGEIKFEYDNNIFDGHVITRYYAGKLQKYGYRLKSIKTKNNGELLQQYDFSYEQKDKVWLMNKVYCSTAGEQLRPLTFEYGEDEYYYLPMDGNLTISNQLNLSKSFTSTDADFIYRRGKFIPGSHNDGILIHPLFDNYGVIAGYNPLLTAPRYKLGSKYPEDQVILFAPSLTDTDDMYTSLTTGSGFQTIEAVDTDGDGVDEIVRVNLNGTSGDFTTMNISIYECDASGHPVLASRFNVQVKGTYSHGEYLNPYQREYFWGDFRGNGKTQLLIVAYDKNYNAPKRFNQTSYATLIDLSSRTKLCEAELFKFTDKDYTNLIICDLDNDSQTELCFAKTSGLDVYRFKDGTGFIKEKTLGGISSYISDESRPYYITDLNGDGYIDIVQAPAVGSSSLWRIYPFDGHSFADTKSTSICNRSSKDDDFMFIDINRDGLPDLVKVKGTTLGFHLNKDGYSFENYKQSPSSIADSKGIIPVNVVDHYGSSSFIKIDGSDINEYSFSAPSPTLRQLTRSIDSYGRVLENNYDYLPSLSLYWKSAAAAVNNEEGYAFRTLPIYVLTSENGYISENSYSDRYKSSSYSYFDGVVNSFGLGFCGFSKILSYDYSGGIADITEEIHDPQKQGAVTSSKKYHGSVFNDSYATIQNSYSQNIIHGRIKTYRLSNSTETDYETGIKKSTSYNYDSYNNPTRVETTCRIGSGPYQRSTQTTRYRNSIDAERYIIGIPLEQLVISELDGNSSSSWRKKNTTEYDNKFHPTVVKKYEGAYYTDKGGRDSTKVVSETRLKYDNRGNVISQKNALYGGTEFLETTYTYDANGRYLISETDPFGHTTTYSGYDKFGNPSTMKDYRGRATTYKYDCWGDLVKTVHADGAEELINIEWGGIGLYTETTTATGKPDKIVHFDALGRELRMAEKRFDGQWLYSDNKYDSRGRLTRTSLPYRGNEPKHWTTYTYDKYDRPTSISKDSVNIITISYYGTSVTTVKDGRLSTSTTDASGNVISVADAGGVITYTLRDDGQPAIITAPGGIQTIFNYDSYGRRTSIDDPSAGLQTESYVYNPDGSSVVTSVNPNGSIITHLDKYGRTTYIERPGEYNTTYSYDDEGKIISEQSTNGTGTIFTYDNLGRIVTVREYIPDNKWLQKTLTYGTGSVLASTQYSTQSGIITTEEYSYANGHNTGITLPDGTIVWRLDAENDLGITTGITTGGINREYGYDDFGIPTYRKMDSGYLQDFRYVFNPATRNLESRQDVLRNQIETFTYDNLNRLVSAGDRQFEYDSFGNIITIGGVGTLGYEKQDRPYQITTLSPMGEGSGFLTDRAQTISYTCYSRPSRINEGERSAAFTYNGAGDRVKMTVKDGNIREGTLKNILTRYYIGGSYECDITYREESGMSVTGRPQVTSSVPDKTIERLYLGGDAYSAPMVYQRENNGNWTIYNIGRDYLGSITHIATADGTLVAEYSYDPWGRLRDPQSLEIYTVGNEPELFIGRGFTGHEHLTWFGLINMNSRLYDPLIGRFLSPDPYVQTPDNSQNFNRYSYALNNPLRYTDESGKFLNFIIGAIIGGVSNWVANGCKFTFKGLCSFAAGAAIGALSSGASALTTAALNVCGTFTGMAVGALTGAACGGATNFLLNGINNLIAGKNFMDGAWASVRSGMISGAISGALTGALDGGRRALESGKNVWWGCKVKFGRTQWSFFTSEKPWLSIDFNLAKINKLANDCVPATFKEINDFFKGKITYEELCERLKYIDGKGVFKNPKVLEQTLQGYFTTSEYSLKDLDFLIEAVDLQVNNKIITLCMRYNFIMNHMDNVRYIHYYSDKVVIGLRIGEYRLDKLINKVHWARAVDGLRY